MSTTSADTHDYQRDVQESDGDAEFVLRGTFKVYSDLNIKEKANSDLSRINLVVFILL